MNIHLIFRINTTFIFYTNPGWVEGNRNNRFSKSNYSINIQHNPEDVLDDKEYFFPTLVFRTF